MTAPSSLPHDYADRVYAGVLGKLIGVYLGRPFEGWTYERIMAGLGEVDYYVHDRPVPGLNNRLLVVTDDDISGTFSFLRALPDYGYARALTPAQIGQTWLNYIVEQRTILWWGGLGNSTEHTAYLRLKAGLAAPNSGAIETNGRIVAEQIGAQIFIDGWAMVAPGDPELAADLARRAASVSHDGEAVYAAQLLAAMEAQAFVERDLDRLLDTGLSFIPRDSLINRLVTDLREWRAELPDWRAARALITQHYGYDKFPGNCHVVPNHALIHLGLLYGGDDFQKALMITNTAGWDTDCNSGNVGCLLGIKNGLAGLDAGPDWRGPVADRLYLSTADGGRAITDAVNESYHIVNIGRALAGQPPALPKDGARFHFSLPGSVQGFRSSDPHLLTVENAGARGLALRYRAGALAQGVRAGTPTFIPPEAIAMPGYGLSASPTLYPGQTVRASIAADAANTAPVSVRLVLAHYAAGNELARIPGPSAALQAGAAAQLEWRMPDLGGDPIAEIGLELTGEHSADGAVYLDSLSWDGPPDVVLKRPAHNGTLWRRAWVDAVDHFDPRYPSAFQLVQDRGAGLLIQGTREWTDYEVSAVMQSTLAAGFGLAARVQGLRRYYALLLCNGSRARLIKSLDGETVLAEAPLPVEWGRRYALALRVTGPRLQAYVDGRLLFDLEDPSQPLTGGAVALVCVEGCAATESVTVRPVSNNGSTIRQDG